MKIIPSVLSIWGFVGSILSLITTVLLMFDILQITTPIYFILLSPIAILELILAVYLIIKGFNMNSVSSVIKS